MSLMPQLGDGYYDDTGNWQRTKFCFVQCQHCTCQAPGGLFYSAAHDKRRLTEGDTIKFGSQSDGGTVNE